MEPDDHNTLPPGPAFIQYDPKLYRGGVVLPGMIPRGYVWQDATESTAAGWVRKLISTEETK